MSLALVPEPITAYALAHSSPQSVLLEQIQAYTQDQVADPQMLSDPLQGRILSFIAHLVQPKRILEIGTFTGYATLCLAESLADNGRIITLDNNPVVAQIAQKFFDQSPYSQRIIQQVGQAEVLIPMIKEAIAPELVIDLAFIDADKTGYSAYYELLLPLMRVGGVIIADNVLWSGKVLDVNTTDADTLALHAFNIRVQEDVRVEQVLLPVRDGLMCVRKVQ